MIDLRAKDSPTFEKSLHTAGGFCWWYVDLVDAEGNGCVAVWSFGLPFLAESRSKTVARQRPCVHFALYEHGRPKLYLLNEHEPETAQVSPTTGSGAVGHSTFLLEEQEGAITLHVQLDEPIDRSGDTLKLDLKVEGRAFRPPQNEARSHSSAHVWAPRSLLASGVATITTRGYSRVLRGSAYIDSNASEVALHEQEILDWRWGRATFSYGTYLYYELTTLSGGREAVVLFESPNEQKRQGLTVSFRDLRRSVYGLNAPRTVHLLGRHSVSMKLKFLVDDGPFYQRYLLEAVDPTGARGWGVAEFVAPPKLDRKWQRPFIRMKTHRLGGENSFFLPLFSGLRGTGGRRLITQVFRGER